MFYYVISLKCMSEGLVISQDGGPRERVKSDSAASQVRGEMSSWETAASNSTPISDSRNGFYSAKKDLVDMGNTVPWDAYVIHSQEKFQS